MPVSPSEYEAFLRPGDVVNVGIDLPDKTFAEDLAIVVAGKAGEIMLQLCGSGFPSHLHIIGGSRVLITRGEGKTIFHCTAHLKEAAANGFLRIELPEKVVVRDRREYMRVDVMLPVNYYLPPNQNMGRVIAEWERMRGCTGECAVDSPALFKNGNSRVNLSGSGLRFKIRDCLSYGTLLHLNIGLPGRSPEHVHAVGAIIRTKELVPEMAHIEYYSTSMAFRMIESSDRLKLMQYILTSQHEQEATPPPGYL
jgi:hypothetical protein